MTTSISEAMKLEIARQRARTQTEFPDERATARAAHEAAAKAKDDATPALAVLDVLAFAGGECFYQVTHISGDRVAARPISSIGRFTGPVEIGLAVGKSVVMFRGFGEQARPAQRAYTRAQVLLEAARRKAAHSDFTSPRIGNSLA